MLSAREQPLEPRFHRRTNTYNPELRLHNSNVNTYSIAMHRNISQTTNASTQTSFSFPCLSFSSAFALSIAACSGILTTIRYNMFSCSIRFFGFVLSPCRMRSFSFRFAFSHLRLPPSGSALILPPVNSVIKWRLRPSFGSPMLDAKPGLPSPRAVSVPSGLFVTCADSLVDAVWLCVRCQRLASIILALLSK
jgi:hypothetical protein